MSSTTCSSSSSSSEYEWNQYWPTYKTYSTLPNTHETVYNTNYRTAFGNNPYYPTMGHPLVYYAETPCPRNQSHCVHRKRCKECNPNCFVRAFRWYTKDHVPSERQPPKKADMAGFAAWLDVKYGQFQQDSRVSSETYHVQMRQTIDAERVLENNVYEPEPCNCAPRRRPQKRKSKNKQRAKSSETATVRQKSNPSCRYIMQPKDISRPPSVCCHPSNTTLVESECVKKPLIRSQSLSSVTMVIKGNEAPATPAPCDVDTNLEGNACQNKCSCDDGNRRQSVEKAEVTIKNDIVVSQDVGSQFCEEVSTKANTETQCDVAVPPNSRRSSFRSNQSECERTGLENNLQRPASKSGYENTQCQPILPCGLSPNKCACKSFDTMPQKPVNKILTTTSRHSQKYVKPKVYNDIECQCPEEKVVTVDTPTQYVARPTNNICECNNKGPVRSYQTPGQNVQIPCDDLLQCRCGKKVEEQVMTDRVMFAQTTSQTSTQSICLGKETVKYPFFLKIICADKLSNETIK